VRYGFDRLLPNLREVSPKAGPGRWMVRVRALSAKARIDHDTRHSASKGGEDAPTPVVSDRRAPGESEIESLRPTGSVVMVSQE
jgi:hypothetical protein